MKTKLKAMFQPIWRNRTLMLWVLGLIVLAVLIILLVWLAVRQGRINNIAQPALTPAPASSSPTPPTQVQPVQDSSASPVVTPLATTPTPTATATPAPTDNSQLPQAAQTLLKDFYAAFARKDRATLATFFTPDTTAEYRSLHSQLFYGVDSQGNPSGPTLFSTSTASQYATAYVIDTFSKSGSDWLVTVKEQRQDVYGSQVISIVTELTLAPSGSDWLIDSYVHSGSAGKYNGFLVQ